AWSPGANWTVALSGANYTIWTTGSTGTGGTTCSAVPVTFTIANAATTFGQNLYVVGDLTALGHWAPASAFALSIAGAGAHVPWTGTLSLPPSTTFQYKYIKQNPTTGEVVWESNQATASGNRERTSAACSSTSQFNDGNFKF